jgi:hypothetical protein
MRAETVQKHIVRKNINGLKIGTNWMIYRDEVLRFIDKRRPPGRPSN